MRKIASIFIIMLMLLSAEGVSEIMETRIIDSNELTLEMLQNRKGTMIIERCYGIVTSRNGDGKLLNCANPDYDYIGYRSVENANVGDIILTYFFYNPDNNIEDDIMHRVDFIISK